uniref:BHLH domain-containing protein n=1 Tax=Neolamprologus brichardi TaxID=32507 RepID=A0A3Q4GZI0_NEOBR
MGQTPHTARAPPTGHSEGCGRMPSPSPHTCRPVGQTPREVEELIQGKPPCSFGIRGLANRQTRAAQPGCTMSSAFSPSFIEQRSSNLSFGVSPPAGLSEDHSISQGPGPGILPYLTPFHHHGHFSVYECPFEPAFIQKRNERERQRVKCVNQGYAKLRDHLPGQSADKRLSKVETLRAAIRYIKYLQGLRSPQAPLYRKVKTLIQRKPNNRMTTYEQALGESGKRKRPFEQEETSSKSIKSSRSADHSLNRNPGPFLPTLSRYTRPSPPDQSQLIP